MALSSRMLKGFAVAALAQGDAGGALALPGLADEAAAQLAPLLRGLAGADAAARRAFLQSALARPAIAPAWAGRLAQPVRRGHRPQPALLVYLAQLSRAR